MDEHFSNLVGRIGVLALLRVGASEKELVVTVSMTAFERA